MNLNYTAFFLIAFVPLVIGWIWYHPRSWITKWSGLELAHPSKIGLTRTAFLFILSLGFVYGYINLVVHQLGFYELFFTDIMLGSEESKAIVQEFLSKYGDKHRHFGHGVLHGFINAFIFALPFIAVLAILEKRTFKYIGLHFGYWLLTSIIIGGLISEFV